MSGFLCSMVGASFTVAAAAQVLRSKKGITAFGNAQVDTAQSQFGGASAYFDGVGDHLRVAHDSSLKFGTGNFTIELWYRPIARTNNFAVIFSNTSEFVTGNIQIDDRNNSTPTKFSVFIVNNSNSAASLVSTTTVANGTWYHLALVRNGTNIGLYVNGTSEASITVASDFVVDDSANTTGYQIGAYYNGDSTTIINGHIDEIRVSNTARYTTTFTPSTTPFVNDANTVLLIHANGTDASTVFEDDNGIGRSARGISAIGNAQIDTAQSKYGGAAALFDGTGDYLIVGNTVDSDMALTSTTWTVEYWARISAHAGQYQATVAIWNDVNATGAVYYFSTNAYSTTNKMGFEYIYDTNTSSGALNFGSALSTGVWQHHAFVRNGNTLTAYLDGVSQGTHDMTGRTIDITGYFSSSNTTMKMTIGAMTGGGGAYNGWLDEIRISNTARYTANFSVATAPFVNDANTVLLLHMNQSDAATIFTDDNSGTVTTEDSYTVPTAAFTSDAHTVALYHFENNGTDSGPNGYTLDVTGGYSSSVVKFGTYSGNLSDSGSDYFAHTTNRQWSPYNGSIVTDWTCEGYFYYTSWTGAAQDFNGTPLPNAIWIADVGGNRLPVLFGFTGAAHSPAGRLTMAVSKYSGGGGDPRDIVATSTTTYNLNTWHHIALTYNSTTGIFKGYINGAKAFTSSVPYGDLYTLPTHLTIGSGNAANSECYVDEVRISRMIRYGI